LGGKLYHPILREPKAEASALAGLPFGGLSRPSNSDRLFDLRRRTTGRDILQNAMKRRISAETHRLAAAAPPPPPLSEATSHSLLLSPSLFLQPGAVPAQGDVSESSDTHMQR